MRISPQLTAVYLYRACGLNIRWTHCLTNHLNINHSTDTVYIYHFKRCLADHRCTKAGKTPGLRSPFPDELLQEAIWTLNLLFPTGDERTVAYLKKCQPPKNFHHDWTGEMRRPLDLDAYSYWKPHLEELLEIYNRGPTTFKQYIAYQKPYERTNLVVAVVSGFILALVFGMISSITAIISTRATLQALDVAKQTYELQLQVPICPCT